MPATLSTASSLPNSSTAARIAASTSASLVTPQCTGSTAAPHSAAVSFSQPLLREAGDAGRYVDVGRRLASLVGQPRLAVQAHRRRDCARHPIRHDVGDELVACERVLGVALAAAPRAELLDDPREQAGR